MDTHQDKPEPAFLLLEPMLDQTDTLDLLVAREIMMPVHAKLLESLNKGTLKGAGGEFAYKVTFESVNVGFYDSARYSTKLEKLEEVPEGMNLVALDEGLKFAEDIIRFKIKPGYAAIYSKKSAESVSQKLAAGTTTEDEASSISPIEYIAEPDMNSIKYYYNDEKVDKKTKKNLESLAVALGQRQQLKKASQFAALWLQSSSMNGTQRLTEMLEEENPYDRLAQMQECVEKIAARRKQLREIYGDTADYHFDSVITNTTEKIISLSRGVIDGSEAYDLAFSQERAAKMEADIDRLFGELYENHVQARSSKLLSSGYWVESKKAKKLEWIFRTQEEVASAYALAYHMSKKDECAKWAEDYLRLLVRTQFRTLDKNRIDLEYAALRELEEIKCDIPAVKNGAVELKFLFENYEKKANNLPAQLHKVKESGMRPDAALGWISDFMQARFSLLSKIEDTIAALSCNEQDIESGSKVSAMASRAKKMLAACAMDICKTDMKYESELIDRSATLFAKDGKLSDEAVAYYTTMQKHDSHINEFLARFRNKESKTVRGRIEAGIKSIINSRSGEFPVYAYTIDSALKAMRIHPYYKDEFRKRMSASMMLTGEELLHKEIMLIDKVLLAGMAATNGGAQGSRGSLFGSVPRRELEAFRDALTHMNTKFAEADQKCFNAIKRLVAQECEPAELDEKMEKLFWPEHINALHRPGLEIRDLIPDLDNIEENFTNFECKIRNATVLIAGKDEEGKVPVRIFCDGIKIKGASKDAPQGISVKIKQFFKYDQEAPQREDSMERIESVKDVIYGKLVSPDEIALSCGSKGRNDIVGLVEHKANGPRDYIRSRLSAKEITDHYIQSVIEKREPLHGKQIFSDGMRVSENPPAVFPREHYEAVHMDYSHMLINERVSEDLSRLAKSDMNSRRLKELFANINSVAKYVVKERRAKHLQRIKPLF